MSLNKLSKLQEKIQESLKILKYDPNKHKDLRSSYTELLNREDINKAISGIITDSNVLEEAVSIIEAWEFLNEHKEEVLEILNKENSLTVTPKVIDEILIYYDEEDKCYRVMKKQKDSKQYTIIHEGEELKEGNNYYEIKINGNWLLCNYKGEFIKYLTSSKISKDYEIERCEEKVTSITNKIIKITKSSRIYRRHFEFDRWDEIIGSSKFDYSYFKLDKTLDGKFKQLIKVSNHVERILSSDEVSDENKNRIFDFVYSGKEINYGKNLVEFKIIHDFVYVVYQDGNVAYFTLEGEKIISTDQDNYFYLGELSSKTTHLENIIVVGRYDKNLNKKYGYFDLQSRKLCSNTNFSSLYNWTDYGGVVFHPELSILKKDGTLIECYEDDCFPIIENPFSYKYPPNMIASSAREWKNEVYIVRYVMYDKNNCPSWHHDNDVVIYALVSDIYTNPKRISDIFIDYKMIDDDYDRILIKPFDALLLENREVNYKLLDINGKIWDIFRKQDDDMKKGISFYQEQKDSNYLQISIQNSAFLLPDYRLNRNTKNNELMTVSYEIEKYHNQGQLKQQDDFNVSDFEGLHSKKRISEIIESHSSGAMIVNVQEFTTGGYLVAVNVNGKPVFYKKAEPIKIDNVGNILMRVPYGNKTRQILVSPNGEVLIGFSNEIIPNDEGLYIVIRGEVYQLYDSCGSAVTLLSEKLEWVEKYYIDEDGVIHNKKKKVLITNAGYKYLLDDDGDITIKENKNYAKILQKVNLLRNIES